VIHVDDLVTAVPGLEVHGPAPADRFERFCFDSRLVEPGDLFVAVRTPRGDGHDHVADAWEGGARAVLVDDPAAVPAGCPALVVDDTVVAMERYGAHVVRRWGPRVVAVTGTVGKTGTKELVADVLATRFTVFRTPGNFNGRFGLAVALGGLRPEHEVAVVEMATGHFGEIDAMCAVAPPEVAVVTAVGAAHLLALGDVEGVAREKATLVGHLPAGGLAVLNADDPRVGAMTGRSPAPVVTFGSAPGADYRADGVVVSGDGTTFTCHHGTIAVPVAVPLLGTHTASAASAALAVAAHFGVPDADAVAALGRVAPVPGRLRPLPGRAGSLLLDDTYNAAPRSVLAGLDTLAALPGSPRIAVLGGMAELGPASEELHREVGRRAAEVVDVLVTQGTDAAWIADAAVRAGLPEARVAITFTTEDAAAEAARHLGPGAVALVKGSAVARMERVVARLLADDTDAAELLVRQDRAWDSLRVVQPGRPTWLEIDLPAVSHNVRHLAARAAGAEVMVVLKADAYGHGAVPVAHTALRSGATWLGVACVPEARTLREARIRAPILVLGYTPGWQARDAVGLDLTLAVFDLETAQAFGQAARALDATVRVHVKVDTGMHRLGVAAAGAAAFVRELATIDGLEVTGLFTHFACADDPSPGGVAATDAQVAAFGQVLADLEATGDRPAVVHASNSAGLLCRSDAVYDLVRPGIAVYGLPPGPAVPVGDLRPVLAWTSQVAQVHDLAAGESVGYGHAWTAARPSRVATVPVGYADGLRRAPATWRHVLVRGRAAPLAGRVSMDQISIDVTDIDGVRRGDEVVLIGRQGSGDLPATTVADWLGTSPYEVVAEILARVPRLI
jgi:Alr-MurF fusion protein